ncbi:MAG: sensor histidine kinase [Eubacteriaceae bacterium]|nr:sensor histidine kinase [Eubacteriaceae bacterium]
MNNIIDKLVIFSLCMVFYLHYCAGLFIVPILIVIIISGLMSYFEDQLFKIISLAIFILISFIYPFYIFFVPLICYDFVLFKIKWLWTLLLFPVAVNFLQNAFLINGFIICTTAVAFILKYRTVYIKNLKTKTILLRDDSKELSIMLEIKNKELMDKQDYEINIATLNERNRIARDIHDNVGHMLSSSILQIGAMLATINDEKIKENLRSINLTLSKAMDSIRKSVHDLHEQSIDLKNEITALVNNFTFCNIELQYDIQSNPDKKLKYCFIAVIKEALSNIIKHSNATHVSVTLREHPALYQLIIQDNGTKVNRMDNEGIGLKNIEDRVCAFKGNFNINKSGGFKIFISIPKA